MAKTLVRELPSWALLETATECVEYGLKMFKSIPAEAMTLLVHLQSVYPEIAVPVQVVTINKVLVFRKCLVHKMNSSKVVYAHILTLPRYFLT